MSRVDGKADGATGQRDRLVGIALLSVGIATLLALGTVVVLDPGPVGPDQAVWAWFVDHRSDPVTLVMRAVSALTAPVPMTAVVAAVAIVWAARARIWWSPVLLVAAVLVATLVSRTLKSVIGRERPPLEDALGGSEATASFPSGHTVGTATFTLVLTYLLLRRAGARSWTWWLAPAVVTAAVMVSRLYLGRHWLTDVLAGLALALATLGAVMLLDIHHRHRAARAPDDT